MKTCPRIRDRGRTLGLFSLSRIFRGRSSDIFDWSRKRRRGKKLYKRNSCVAIVDVQNFVVIFVYPLKIRNVTIHGRNTNRRNNNGEHDDNNVSKF